MLEYEEAADDPWQNGETQREDAEAFEIQPVELKEAIQEVLLMVTERVSIL